MWVMLPDARVAFIGDAVTISEPPYLGEAHLEDWLETLDVMRDAPYEGYKIIGSRDGMVHREDINAMARFLRKVPVRLDRMQEDEKPQEAAAKYAEELLEDFEILKNKRDQAKLRLEAGLKDLFRRQHEPNG
jgi:glyoxylase-like metal-dependent hydrolase (beta-lactamase superfamily II)